MKLLLACPTYGPVDPRCVSTLRYSMMVAAHHGTSWIADASPDRMTYSTARNTVAQWVFDNPSKVDGIMWVDSDIVPEPDSIWRLLGTAEKHGHDILSGVYHERHPPHEPLFHTFNPETRHFKRCHVYEPNTIIAVDGCGFGFVWTSTKSIQTIRKHPDFNPDTGRWFPDNRQSASGFGEDLSFCFYAMQMGVRVHVDTGVQVGHCGEMEVVTREHQIRLLESQKAFIPVRA